MDFYTYRAKLNPAKGIDSVYDGDTITKMVIDCLLYTSDAADE